MYASDPVPIWRSRASVRVAGPPDPGVVEDPEEEEVGVAGHEARDAHDEERDREQVEATVLPRGPRARGESDREPPPDVEPEPGDHQHIGRDVRGERLGEEERVRRDPEQDDDEREEQDRIQDQGVDHVRADVLEPLEDRDDEGGEDGAAHRDAERLEREGERRVVVERAHDEPRDGHPGGEAGGRPDEDPRRAPDDRPPLIVPRGEREAPGDRLREAERPDRREEPGEGHGVGERAPVRDREGSDEDHADEERRPDVDERTEQHQDGAVGDGVQTVPGRPSWRAQVCPSAVGRTREKRVLTDGKAR